MTLPSELNSLIKERSGFAILIKGPAGVGKTLLTLEMLLSAPRGLYMSTRVSPQALVDQVSGFEQHSEKIKVIDASQPMLSSMARPGSGKHLMFNTLKYHDMTDFVQALVGELDALTKESEDPLLVAIDSWDAIMEGGAAGKDEMFRMAGGQKRVEAFLSDVVKFTNVNLILVAEHAKPSFLDYLVDVVLFCNLEYIDGQPVRTLEIRKMRGARIDQPRYTYSLEGGRFMNFEKFSFRLPEILVRRDPIPDPRPQLMSSGSEHFDAILGDGIKYGSWLLFEVGTGIGDGFFQFVIPLIANHLNQERDLFLVLPQGTNIYQFEKYHAGFVPRELFKNHVTVFEMAGATRMKEKAMSTVLPIADDPVEMFGLMENLIAERGTDIEKPPLLLLSLDTLELYYESKEFLRALSSNITFTKNFLNVTLALAKAEQECLSSLSHLSTAHWKLELVNQSLFLRGIQPITGYFGVRTKLSEGFISNHFIPVV